MAAGIMYVACPKCGKEALELVSFTRNTVSIECDSCDYRSMAQLEAEPDRAANTDPLPA